MEASGAVYRGWRVRGTAGRLGKEGAALAGAAGPAALEDV
jgi:hypothetical protein